MNFTIVFKINLAFLNIVEGQVESLKLYSKNTKEYFKTITTYLDSIYAFLTQNLKKEFYLKTDCEQLILSYNNESDEDKLSTPLKGYYHSRFNQEFLCLWDLLDQQKNENIEIVSRMLSSTWKQDVMTKLKHLYFDYTSSSLKYYLSIILFFTELKKGFKGEFVGQLKFDTLVSAVTVDNFDKKSLEMINELKPKKDKKKAIVDEELNLVIKSVEININSILSEYQMTSTAVDSLIKHNNDTLLNLIEKSFLDKTTFVNELTKVVKYSIEAESEIKRL